MNGTQTFWNYNFIIKFFCRRTADIEKLSTPSREILLYNNGDESEFVNIISKNENFWITQKAKGKLFVGTADKEAHIIDEKKQGLDLTL